MPLSSASLKPVIGLEVHAQIYVPEKLFSRAPTHVFGQNPNACVSFVDMAFPGMLPVLNRACLMRALQLGIAVKGKIAPRSVFERKHYFYPDLASGYQISQYQSPLIEGGTLTIEMPDGQTKSIGLERIHIEQDAGQILHDQAPDASFVNFNRAGIGLMEIVSKPELETPQEVVAYVKTLQNLMRYLDVCQGDMEKGHMRVDANVSVHCPGTPLGTRVELKNMNSPRFLEKALVYEIQRQKDCLARGEKIIQETRSYHVPSGQTRTMRTKENAPDYLYFPDPDLPVVVIAPEEIQHAINTMPELPWFKKERFEKDFGLTAYDARLLCSDRATADYFEKVLTYLGQEPKSIKAAANWILGELFALVNAENLDGLSVCPVAPESIAQIVTCVLEGRLTQSMAKEALGHLWKTGKNLEEVIKTYKLETVVDEGLIAIWVAQVLEEEKIHVEAYRAGKEKILGYLLGQLMRKAQGKANPQKLREILIRELALS